MQREALLVVKKGFLRNEKGVSLIGEKILLQEKELLINMKKTSSDLIFIIFSLSLQNTIYR
jgi:hypothetical protein